MLYNMISKVQCCQQLLVDVVFHLVLQVNLGPTGEEQLHNSTMTPCNGNHEGSPAILRNE